MLNVLLVFAQSIGPFFTKKSLNAWYLIPIITFLLSLYIWVRTIFPDEKNIEAAAMT